MTDNAPTIDPDKLLSPTEAVAAFGLTEGTWRAAMKDGELRASGSRGTGTFARAEDCRAFALKWHEEHPITIRNDSTKGQAP